MIISVINHTDGEIPDEELQRVIQAINRQISENFEPYWSLGGQLRLEGRSTTSPPPAFGSDESPVDMRGDAVIYLWNDNDIEGAIGYHDRNHMGIPFGFVFTQVSDALGEPWSVTLSHEALELLGDPEVNLLVAGPHPEENRTVFHWYEMCDACQADVYTIDDVAVSNFVLPLYFTGGEEFDGRNDFLGKVHVGQTLQSFGVNPGGYVGFFDPELGRHDTFSARGDHLAAARMETKFSLKLGRRGVRYQQSATKEMQEFYKRARARRKR